jgi:hypothetical protein
MSLAIYNLPTHIRYNGTSPPIDFLDKYNTISNLYQWSENHKCHMLRFFLEGAAADFWESYTQFLARQQGVDKDQIVFNWQEVTKSLLNSFSGRESYEALEKQLRNIKFSPLGAEAFYFAISNILDKMSIVDPTRRIQKYINLLPTEIARSLALSFPKNELDILLTLKKLDNYHRSIETPTVSQSNTICHLDMATDIAQAIINHLDYNPLPDGADNISSPDETDYNSSHHAHGLNHTHSSISLPFP